MSEIHSCGPSEPQPHHLPEGVCAADAVLDRANFIPRSSQTPPTSTGRRQSSGVWIVSNPDPEPLHRLVPSQVSCLWLSHARRHHPRPELTPVLAPATKLTPVPAPRKCFAVPVPPVHPTVPAPRKRIPDPDLSPGRAPISPVQPKRGSCA